MKYWPSIANSRQSKFCFMTKIAGSSYENVCTKEILLVDTNIEGIHGTKSYTKTKTTLPQLQPKNI